MVKNPMDQRPDHVKEEKFEAPKGETEIYPKVKLMQALSPEMDKTEEAYIKEAEVGMLLLEANPNILVDGDVGIKVIILAIRKRYAEFQPNRGGFVASYDSREEMEANFTAGNDISAVIEYLVQVDGVDDIMVVSFGSPTALGVAAQWGKLVEQYKTMHGVKYHITSRAAKNKKSQTYYKMKVEAIGWVEKAQLEAIESIAAEHMAFLPTPVEDSEI